MKVPPLNLAPENMSRVNMPMHLSPEFIWRSYNQSFLSQSASATPSSPIMMDIKSCNGLDIMKTIPSQLNLDPRTWSRDDVVTFLRWVEKEYDLPSIDNTKFYMNGKALMMLNKNDLTERAPAAGDILHNTLQQILGQSAHVPPSPLTPHHPILSPSPLTSSASNPSQPWGFMADFHNLSHLLQQNSSVTLSPAHSEQSGGSPRHPDNASTTSNGSAPGGYSHSGSQSDSEDSTRDSTSPQRSPIPPHQPNLSAQALANIKHISNYQRAAAAAAAVSAVQQQSIKHEDSAAQHYKQQLQQAIQLQQQQNKATHQQQLHQQIPTTSHMSLNHNPVSQIRSSPPLAPITSNTNTPQTPDEPVEPGTNGRLLWDFLQQLLNDREQRYNRYIAWRNAETGVFKIVDPPGLARLWGIQKNHLSMNYDKMSRALRYYYRVNILRKVQGERHCYQFLRNPSELRNIKNISSLKMHPAPARAAVNSANLPPVHNSSSHLQPQSMSHHPMQSTTLHPQSMHHQSAPEPIEEDEGPTDLSMATLNDNNQKLEVYVKMEDDINVDYD